MRLHLRRLAWSIGGLLAIYLIVVNVLLNTALGPQLINHQPEKFRMQWRAGLSWFPGQVVLWNVQFNGHVRRVAWQANAAYARGRIGLLPLLQRELRLATVWAEQVQGDLDLVANREPPEPRPGGWTLRFDRIATDSLQRVRFADWHLSAVGSAEFGMSKQLRGGPLEIYPSQARLRDVRLLHADTEVLRQGTLGVQWAMRKHSRADAAGWARLALTDAQIELVGQVPALAVQLSETVQWQGAVVGDASGRIAMNLALHQGQLQPGGVLDLAVPLHASNTSGQQWTSHAGLQASVAQDISLRLALPPPPGGSGGINADLRVAGTALPMPATTQALLDRVSGTIGVNWRFDSLEWLGPLLARAAWLKLNGAGAIEAELVVVNGKLSEGTKLHIPDVDLSADVQGQRINGRARADGRLTVQAGEPAAQVDITLEKFAIAATQAPGQAFVRGRDLKLALSSTGRLSEFRDSLKARLSFQDALVPDLRSYNIYLPKAAVRLLGGSGQLSGDLALDAAGKMGSGRLRVRAKRAQVAAGDLEFSGDIDLDAQLAQADLATQSYAIDGTRLKLSNVRVTDPQRASPGDWWCDIRFDRGRMQWAHPLILEASTRIEMYNVGLLLGLFTRHRDYPRWVLRVLDKGMVSARARAALHDGGVVLDDVEIANDRFDLKARLHLAERRASGDLYLRWAKLGLGLELRGDARKFHLLKAADWFAQQPRLLPATAATRARNFP